MALGRLEAAIARYRQAEATAAQGNIEWELAEWGLGVALDRDEQVGKSQQAIQRALDVDPAMAHLADESVFFEPAGDKRYYEALGHEVAGDRELALAGWRAFLAEAPTSQYARRARAHLNALKRAPALPSTIDPARLRVSIGEIMDLHGLRSASSLREIVAQHRDELRLCYARALRSEPQARGELRLQLIIDPSGWLYGRAHVLLVDGDRRPSRTLRGARRIDLALPAQRCRGAGRDRRDRGVRQPMIGRGLPLVLAAWVAMVASAKAASWDEIAQPNRRRCTQLLEQAAEARRRQGGEGGAAGGALGRGLVPLRSGHPAARRRDPARRSRIPRGTAASRRGAAARRCVLPRRANRSCRWRSSSGSHAK